MAADSQETSQYAGADARLRVKERMVAIVQELQKEADDRVSKRSTIEERWITDLRQFHGQYEDKILRDLKEAKRSNLFINLTRAKTNAMEARLSDMLFPTDDRNWGIGPTPVPELTTEAENSARAIAKAKLGAIANPNDPTLAANVQSASAKLEAAKDRMEVAKQRADAMQEEIDDALRQCNYSAQARMVIRDACRIGTGIIKGPVTGGRPRRSWAKSKVPGQENVYELKTAPETDPKFWRVDPWNFFPDSDAAVIEDSEGVYERHPLNKKQLRRLADQPNFDRNAIRRLLSNGPRGTPPQYYADLLTLTGGNNNTPKDRYHVWEYHGPLDAQKMRDLSLAADPTLMEDLGEIDELAVLEVVIWFCQGEVLKVGLHSLDSEETIYSVFNLEKDESSVFGYGIPFIMRDPQKALAAAWRTLMDNMGLAAGPQIVIDESVIEPADGEWIITPRKVWRRKATASPNAKPFETFDIPSHIEDLIKVIELSRRNVDEETAMPMIAQGEQGAQVTKTFQGMAILMNSVNVVFRRIIKNWDDDMTTPGIRRIYHWLMQFSPKDYIKGDYQVDARGTSVLLVREMQSQNLMVFLAHFSGHPKLGKFLKEDGLPALRQLVRTLLIESTDVIKSEIEISQDAADEAGKPPPPNPEMEKIVQQLNLERLKGENSMQLEGMRRETALIELAAKGNMKLEELRQLLGAKDADRASKERIMAAEAAVEEKNRRMEAAAGQKPAGSGGYFSA